MKKVLLIVIITFVFGYIGYVSRAQEISVPKDSLIKASFSSVYYYASDGNRYVFPNQKAYASWFSDYSKVLTITDEELALIPLRGNITYRPGIRMVKIQTNPKVYVVDKGGLLRWVETEELAEELYGKDWNLLIDDISDVFFINYKEGDPISSSDDYVPDNLVSEVKTINKDKGLEESGSAPVADTGVGGVFVPISSLTSDATSTVSSPFATTATSTAATTTAIDLPASTATSTATSTSTSTTTTDTATTTDDSADTDTTTATSTDAEVASFGQSHTCGTPLYVPEYSTNVQIALDAACSGDTIYLAAGTYTGNLIIPVSGLTLKGAEGTSPEDVIIDGIGSGNVVYVYKISSFTIEGLTLQNANQNGSLPGSAGLHLNPIWTGAFTAKNLIVKDNSYGIVVWNINSGIITIEDNLIIDNLLDGIYGNNTGSSELNITNNTIADNSRNGYADWAGEGNRTLRNNIIANNASYGIYPHRDSGRTILYNDVWNNTKGNYYEGYSGSSTAFTPSPGAGEISKDPSFVSSSDYNLKDDSPAIDAGDPSSIYNDPNGTRNDMGVYRFTGTPAPKDETSPVISDVLVAQTATTTIVTWNTDESATSNVKFGTDTPVDQSSYSEIDDTALTDEHYVSLKGLIPDTIYYFYVYSEDKAGNSSDSEEQSFTTAQEGAVLGVSTSIDNPLGLQPGWLVKSERSFRVYYVDNSLCFHWVTNEVVANERFGEDWNKQIMEYDKISAVYKYCSVIE